MLDWTGERFLPWVEDAAIAYEHFHRYLYASQYVKNRLVLDLATGEGYGANILASSASMVVGIDIDVDAVRHAAAKYKSPKLQFIAGSITDIPLAAGSFDMVTCFEAIEHIEGQERLLAEVKRALAADGVLIVSTPNKTAYQADSETNPFHVKELSPDEFETMLRTQFKNVRFLGQRIYPNSNIWQLENNSLHTKTTFDFMIERGESEFQVAPKTSHIPIYMIAFASDAPFAPTSDSLLVDVSDQLIRQKDLAIADLLAGKASDQKALEWLNQLVKDKELAIAGLEEALQWRGHQIDDLQRTVGGLQEAVVHLQHVIDDLKQVHEAALALKDAQIEQIHNDRMAVRHDLEVITSSTGWKFILQLCRIRDAVFPEGTRRRRLLKRVL